MLFDAIVIRRKFDLENPNILETTETDSIICYWNIAPILLSNFIITPWFFQYYSTIIKEFLCLLNRWSAILGLNVFLSKYLHKNTCANYVWYRVYLEYNKKHFFRKIFLCVLSYITLSPSLPKQS